MLDAYDSRKQKLCYSIALVHVLLAKRKTMSKAKAKGFIGCWTGKMKDAYDVLMYSPLGDSPFFCFELNYIWEISFSPTKGGYNEYNCILANIVVEVLKHVSHISWGYVILI